MECNELIKYQALIMFDPFVMNNEKMKYIRSDQWLTIGVAVLARLERECFLDLARYGPLVANS